MFQILNCEEQKRIHLSQSLQGPQHLPRGRTLSPPCFGVYLPVAKLSYSSLMWTTRRRRLFIVYFFVTFSIRVQPINKGVVSGEQQRDSAKCIHASILPQMPLPSRLPHDTEQSSLCYSVGPCWLSILNIESVYLNIPNSITIPSLCPSPTGNQRFVLLSL